MDKWMFNKGNCTQCAIVVVANGKAAVMTESRVSANDKDMIWSLIGDGNYCHGNYSLFFQERNGPSSLRGRLKMGDDHRYQVAGQNQNAQLVFLERCKFDLVAFG